MPAPIYLDNNSTTPLDPEVLDAMIEVYRSHYGNASSSTHPYGWYAAELIKIAREDVASLIGAASEEIVFTSGATEANNLAILGVARAADPRSRKELLSVATEHDAVLDPMRELKKSGYTARFLPVRSHGDTLAGLVSAQDFEAALSSSTLLASVMLANNEIGVIQDISTLAGLARDTGAVFHTDATQAVGKIPVSVAALGVDLLSCTAHKMYGPKGVGALYIRKGAKRPNIEPLFFGGGHENALRSGTLNVPGIVGFGVACRVAKRKLAADMQRIAELSTRLRERLQSTIEGVEVNGCLSSRLAGNLNLLLPGVDTVRLLGLTNTKVAYSTTAACQSDSISPSHVLAALGLSNAEQSSSIRLGIGRFTTAEEVDAAAEILIQAIALLRG